MIDITEEEINLQNLEGLGELEFYQDALEEEIDVLKKTIKKEKLYASINAASSYNRNETIQEIKKDGSYIEYIKEEFQNDYEIVFEAVKTYGWALQYASEALQSDYEIVWNQLQINPYAIEFASTELKSHNDLIKLYIDYFVGEFKMYKNIEEFLINEECLVDTDRVKEIYNKKLGETNGI